MPTLLDERPSGGTTPDRRAEDRRAEDRRAEDRRAEDREVVVRVVTESAPARRRSARTLLHGLVAVLVLVILAGLAGAGFLVARAVSGVDVDLFGTTSVDRSAPVVLRELRNVAEFTAATGEFQSTVDVEKDVAVLPAVLAGERTIYVGVGTVDARVDFSALARDAVTVGPDRTVRITLPAPTLSTPAIDPARSYVADRDRGIVNRVAGVFRDSPTSERELALVAQQRLARAARASDLAARAERNTAAMLEGLLGRLGYERVDVSFAAPVR